VKTYAQICEKYLCKMFFVNIQQGKSLTFLWFLLQGIMGSIEDGLNRIVEAITPRGLGGHGPRKVKVNT